MLKLLENSNSVESSFYYSKDVIKRALDNKDPVVTISGNINEDAAIDLYLSMFKSLKMIKQKSCLIV